MSLAPRFDPTTGRLRQAYLLWTDAGGNARTLVFDLVVSEQWTGGADVTENPVEQGANITDNIRRTLRKCTLQVFATNHPIGASQWADADRGPSTIQLPGQDFEPWDGKLDVQTWNSHLRERILAGSVGGLLGSAVGGAVGGAAGSAVGGALGSAAAAALAGELLKGEIVHTTVQTDGGKVQPTKGALIQPVSQQFLTGEGDFVQQTIALLEELLATGQTVDVIGTKTTCQNSGSLGGMAIESLTHVRGAEEGAGASITIGLKEIRVATTATVPAPAPTLPRAAPANLKKGNQETSDLSAAAAEAANAFAKGFKDGKADVAALTGSP